MNRKLFFSVALLVVVTTFVNAMEKENEEIVEEWNRNAKCSKVFPPDVMYGKVQVPYDCKGKCTDLNINWNLRRYEAARLRVSHIPEKNIIWKKYKKCPNEDGTLITFNPFEVSIEGSRGLSNLDIWLPEDVLIKKIVAFYIEYTLPPNWEMEIESKQKNTQELCLSHTDGSTHLMTLVADIIKVQRAKADGNKK